MAIFFKYTLFLWVILATSMGYAAPNFPMLSARVVDDVNLLSFDVKNKLIDDLKAFEDSKQIQVAVAIVNSLEGYEIRDYGVQLARHWSLGQRGENNGVLLLVAPNERKVSIEVGYGLEGSLTDALSFLIIQQKILPQFKQGEMGLGIEAGIDAIIQALNGDMDEQHFVKQGREAELDAGAIIFFIFFFAVVIFIIISAIKNGGGGHSGGNTSGSWSSSSRSSGGSSGGFSGGGGSFGGGGSSGGW